MSESVCEGESERERWREREREKERVTYYSLSTLLKVKKEASTTKLE